VSVNASSPLDDAAVTGGSPAGHATGTGSVGAPARNGRAPQEPRKPRAPRRLSASARHFGVDRFSGLYVMVALIIAFSLWESSTFGTISNARIVVSSEAISAIVALAAVVGLVAGVFDLSIAANMSLAISLVGVLQASDHMNALLAVVVTLAIGALVGLTNAFIVTRLGIDAVIGTLAMSSILAAASYWVADGQTILYGISPTFDKFGSSDPLGIPVSVYYLAGIALIMWYVLEHTPTGRYLYAAGANPRAARLSGVKVVRLQVGALIFSGILSAGAGVLLTAQLGASSFGAGAPYLLPAFAAAFLGSTQIKPGRFNVLGTLVSIYLLAVGVKGIQLKYPQFAWVPDLVEGVILLVAVGVAVQSARRRALRA
jgi:ribose transport system permease protein